MNLPRASGVLLHPTSLPGPFGIGDFGPEAFQFVDFLAAAGQRYWAILPLGPTGLNNSPYQSYSAFAGNTLLVSPQRLLEEGLLAQADLADLPELPEGRVAFEHVGALKRELLATAYERFCSAPDSSLQDAFAAFCRQHAEWLEDYALFVALRDSQGGAAWSQWEPALARREPAALQDAKDRLGHEADSQKFYQFLFFRQWESLGQYAHGRAVRIIGDVPIFVAHDSADVWTHPTQFKLDAAGLPRVVSGVPPDYFSRTGQIWDNPLFDWQRMKADGFSWWIARLRAALQVVDVLRMDHFRGFAAYWEIPGGALTAEGGHWVPGPGRELFRALEDALGELPVIAEDLGVITPDVDALREACGFPGMRVLQFAFTGDRHSRDLPHYYVRNLVAYTGTHDNDTVLGWLGSEPGKDSTQTAEQIRRERQFALRYVNCRDPAEAHWDFIRTVFASVADTAIVPLQDVLGLGSEARMNVPGMRSGGWDWRYGPGAITDEVRHRLREITELYGRC